MNSESQWNPLGCLTHLREAGQTPEPLWLRLGSCEANGWCCLVFVEHGLSERAQVERRQKSERVFQAAKGDHGDHRGVFLDRKPSLILY